MCAERNVIQFLLFSLSLSRLLLDFLLPFLACYPLRPVSYFFTIIHVCTQLGVVTLYLAPTIALRTQDIICKSREDLYGPV